MSSEAIHPVFHLELHTSNLARACSFYTRLFGWRAERIHVGASSYLALEVGDGIGAGVVERDDPRAVWLPYVKVPDVYAATAQACMLGATVATTPREGPAGWRSTIVAPDGCEVGLWQPKP